MGEVDLDTLTALQRAIPGMAKRAVPVPTFRFGSVVEVRSSSELVVLVDGDTDPTVMNSAVGAPLTSRARVLVCYYPPSGVIVAGTLGSGSLPGGLVGSFEGGGTDFLTATLGTLAPVPSMLYADRVYRAHLTCVWSASIAGTTLNVDLDLDLSGVGAWATLRSFRGTASIASAIGAETIAGHVDFSPAEDGYYDVRAVGSTVAGTGLVTVDPLALRVSIDDVGIIPD